MEAPKKNFLYFRRKLSEFEKKCLTFWEIELSSPKLKSFLYFKKELAKSE